MKNFKSFYGIVTMINDFLIDETGQKEGCYKLMSTRDKYGNIVIFIISPSTYFVEHEIIQIGDMIVGFYDANAPVPLIFPPQFRAIVIARDTPYRNVKVDYFNSELISTDNTLKLNNFGEFLFKQGDVANAIYLIKEGSFKLVRITENGEEVIIQIVGQGEIIGEANLFRENIILPISAVALEKAKVCSIDIQSLEEVINNEPKIALHKKRLSHFYSHM